MNSNLAEGLFFYFQSILLTNDCRMAIGELWFKIKIRTKVKMKEIVIKIIDNTSAKKFKLQELSPFNSWPSKELIIYSTCFVL